jgi:hypothetical protein
MMPSKRAEPIQSTGAPGSTSPTDCATLVSTPNLPRICRMPIAPTNGGRISGTSSNPLAIDLPQKLKRTLSRASGTLMAVQTSVVQMAISALFSSPCRSAWS